MLVAAFSVAVTHGPAEASSETTTGVAARAQLSWAPPRLVRPTTVRIADQGQAAPSLPRQHPGHPATVFLDAGRDYVLELGHRRGPGGLRVQGGRNVVIIGGRVTPTLDADAGNGRGLTFFDQTGTVHLEGVAIAGAADGILISAPRATFQVQNVRIDVSAPNHDFSINHPDVIQTWSGPAVIRIDALTGTSDYQGFFWYHARGPSTVPPGRVIQRRVNIRTDPRQGRRATLHHVTSHLSPGTYFACSDCWMETGWRGGQRRRLQDSVLGYVDEASGRFSFPPYRLTGARKKRSRGSAHPNLGRRTGDRIEWPSVLNLAKERWHWGVPPGGDFVAADVPGTRYVSPGYKPAEQRHPRR
jgi:hypothetical protein